MTNDPSYIRPEVSDMQDKAKVCNTLMGGTLAMRAAGREYLPQWPRESNEGWESRRHCSVLFPAYRSAVDSMVGKPLGEPVTLQDVPPPIADALENADLQGRDLDTFAREWFRRSLVDGIGWVLVDYPRVPEGATLAVERQMNARPYLVHIPLSKVCGWKTEAMGSTHRLTQFRWRECIEEPEGEFGLKVTERIKVWEPGEVKVYIKDGGEWALDLEESGTVSLKEMPIVCFAPGYKGFYTAEPPLDELAWLNIMHWQSSSDQRNILHVARVPQLTADKAPLGADGQPIAVGPNDLIVGFEGLRFLEHSGAAIGAGRQDLIDLKDEMRIVAGRVLTRQAGGDSSATESALEAKDGGARLRYWAWAFQDCLEECLRLMAAWIGEKEGGIATVSMDWDSQLDPMQLQTALNARTSGELSREAWLHVAQRFRILRPGVAIEDEIAAIESEGPAGGGYL